MTAQVAGVGRLERWLGRLPLLRGRSPESLPMRLEHRRIYVLPTRLGLLVGGVLLAMLLGALNYNNNAGLVLAFLLIAVVIISAVVAHLGLAGLRLEALQAEPVHAGGRLALRLVFDSGQRARQGLWLQGGEGEAALLAGPAATRLEAVLKLPANRRGRQGLGRLRLTTTHPLGLVRAWAWIAPEAGVLVYPALETPPPALPGAADRGPGRPRPDRSGEDTHHLRDYRPGDAPRQIAWKASARSGQLRVREYEAGVAQELVLDWHTLPGLGTEARIRRLAAWVVEAERQGRRSRLVLPSGVLGPGRGAAHRHACLEALALLPAAPG